ncbi:MAG: hypothetical protein ABL962_17240, partial [Fimbriimonadaceae bacterium]
RPLLALTLMLPSFAFAQQTNSRIIRAKDAIAAAHSIKGDAEKEQAYLAINSDSLQDGSDVVAVYEELDKLPAAVLARPTTPAGDIPAVKHLLDVLADARQPQHHAAVSALLEKENSKLTPKVFSALKAMTAGDYYRMSRRADRLYALTVAAGLGQNMQALPVLRAMRKKGGQSGKNAETAIAQLGVDEDLNELIEEIKKNPKSLVNLDGFGLKGYRRIVKELNDSTLTEDEQNRIAGRFPHAIERQYLPDALALLKHKNPHIVDIAADTIRSSVTSDDSVIIREMLASQNPSIRYSGLLAIDRLWNPKYISDVLEVLKGSDGWAQSMAAHMLGHHKVQESATALLDVVNNPNTSHSARESAKHALGELKK